MKWRGLFRTEHFLDEFFKAWMTAQGVEELIDFEENKIISVAVLIGLFEQLDCLVRLAKSYVNKTKIVRRNVTFLRSLPQSIKHGQRLVSATDLCVKVTE